MSPTLHATVPHLWGSIPAGSTFWTADDGRMHIRAILRLDARRLDIPHRKRLETEQGTPMWDVMA